MPAVNLIRLRLQIEELLSFIETPNPLRTPDQGPLQPICTPSLRISDSSVLFR